MEFFNAEPGHLIIVFLKCMGLWSFENTSSKNIYKYYGWLLHSLISANFILCVYLKVAFSDSFKERSECLHLAFCETAFFIKLVTFLIYSQEVKEIFEILQTYEMGSPKTIHEENLINELYKGFISLRNFYGFGTALVLFFCTVFPLISMKLPYPFWTPFNNETIPNFYFAYGFGWLGLFSTATSNCTMDLCMSYFLFHMSAYLKLLGMRYEQFGHDGTYSTKELKQLFQFHDFIIKTTSKCERVVSVPVFFQMFLSALVICFSAYLLNQMNFKDDKYAFLMTLAFAVVMCLQIYLPCKYGHELTLSSYNLTNCIYNSNWIHFSNDVRKDIYTCMEFLKKPLVVRAGNFIEIGLGVFSQTMSNAYRIYALLVSYET